MTHARSNGRPGSPLQGDTILFSEMTPAPEWAQRFHHWYDTEHIPNRRGLPGFLSAQRYRSTAKDSYLAVYEMESASALSTEEYRVVKEQPSDETRWMLSNVDGFTRYTCNQISLREAGDGKGHSLGAGELDAPVLYAVWFDVPAERKADFDAWYDEDHVPLLMQCEDWRMVRRFDVASGEPGRYTRLALHYLADVAALDSDARKRARETPWRARIASEPWFRGVYDVFVRHGARQILSE
ncbi:hypothetical protein L602_000800000690 [Cupriavidus gilardii J11]|uniref:EthD domain-containing protein n=1 Tax=Cupriavidus gilardii J11 TaxID=936133 RepID=A0A562B267_9BURK|nr:DUF4286 family protein [Cupriavidus gilardii]TWG79000.1 hypothetical protein L602_000800000690 [Cupriavidus gilardii J11]